MLNKIFHFIFDHWPAKLISLLLAISLWAFVVNTGYRSAVFSESIPITPRDIPDGLALATELPEVQIEVFAPTASYQALKAQDIQAFINLAGLKEGQHTLEVKVFADDPNVRITQITPSLVDISLEKEQTQEFNVTLETEGELGQGYVADEPTLNPNRVLVTGAASLLKKIDKVAVRLPLNGETTNVEKNLNPKAFNKEHKNLVGLSFEPKEVLVKLPVIKAEDAKTVSIEVVTTGQPPEGYLVGTITTDPDKTAVQGSSKALSEITTLKTEPIDINEATQDIELTVKLVLPDNLRADPSQVNVKIEIKAGSLTEEFIAIPKITNLKSGLEASLEPRTFKVSISGPANLISDVRHQDLILNLDLSDKEEGEYTIDLTAQMLDLPQELSINFIDNRVTVSIVSK